MYFLSYLIVTIRYNIINTIPNSITYYLHVPYITSSIQATPIRENVYLYIKLSLK